MIITSGDLLVEPRFLDPAGALSLGFVSELGFERINQWCVKLSAVKRMNATRRL